MWARRSTPSARMRPVVATARRPSFNRPKPCAPSISRQRCHPTTAGASISEICLTTGSRTRVNQAAHLTQHGHRVRRLAGRRDEPMGSLFLHRLEHRLEQSLLVGEVEVQSPSAHPASWSTASTELASYPFAAKRAVATSIRRRRVARPPSFRRFRASAIPVVGIAQHSVIGARPPRPRSGRGVLWRGVLPPRRRRVIRAPDGGRAPRRGSPAIPPTWPRRPT